MSAARVYIRPLDPVRIGKVGCATIGCRQPATYVQHYQNAVMAAASQTPLCSGCASGALLDPRQVTQ